MNQQTQKLTDQFEVIDRTETSPVILHAPHGSTVVPEAFVTSYTVTATELGEEISKLTDHHTDELVRSIGNASKIINGLSRLVVDVERFPDDREEMLAVGMGAFYTHGSDRQRIRSEQATANPELRAFFDAYSLAFTDLVQKTLDRWGHAIIIDVHSYPQHALPYELHSDEPRPQLVIGTDDVHTPAALTEQVRREFSSLESGENQSFHGTYVPLKFYETQDARVRSIMLEIRRDTYMNEETTAKQNEGFSALQESLESLVTAFAEQATQNTGPTAEPKPLAIAYNDDYLNWQLGSGDGTHPTNPIRAKLATEMLVSELGERARIIDPTNANPAETRAAIETVHDPEYVGQVIDEGESDEWFGDPKPLLGETAALMFAGTKLLVEGMLAGDVTVGFNPQGAKHHAQFAHSSGFCVFNDMAWAALEFERHGLKPLYIDWDIHAGDGVQHLLEHTSIATLSVHNHSNFPGDPETVNGELAREGKRHTAHDPERAIYNWGINPHDGDDALDWALSEMDAVVTAYNPDIILLAAGADGHTGPNNLGASNNYSYAGFEHAAKTVARWANTHSQGRVLIGGAGGYQPLDHTPRIWANVVKTIFKEVQ